MNSELYVPIDTTKFHQNTLYLRNIYL